MYKFSSLVECVNVYGIGPCFRIMHGILAFEKNVKIKTIDLRL